MSAVCSIRVRRIDAWGFPKYTTGSRISVLHMLTSKGNRIQDTETLGLNLQEFDLFVFFYLGKQDWRENAHYIDYLM